jgi:hypothetical protein
MSAPSTGFRRWARLPGSHPRGAYRPALLGGLAATVVLLLLAGTGVARADEPDPALACNPALAAFARQHPADWEQRLDPSVRPMAGWQRIVGCHAQVIGWADEQPNPTYPHPRVVIDVAGWDHTDLFGLGLPRTYDDKPVVIHETVVPSAAGLGQSGLVLVLESPPWVDGRVS